jgi:GNAT superfamily N-acetyltransferase
MIERILNGHKFKILADDIFSIFDKENLEEAHQCGLIHDKACIVRNLGNSSLLEWDVFVWANKNKDGKYDAVIIFLNDKNIKFNEHIFSEWVWLSKNPKVGFKLFKKAIDFAREKGFKYISINSVEKTKNCERNEKFYKKIGFLKDTTTFISKL